MPWMLLPDLVCAPELWTCDLLLNTGPSPAAASPGGCRGGCCGIPQVTAAVALQLCTPGGSLCPGQSCSLGPSVVLEQGGEDPAPSPPLLLAPALPCFRSKRCSCGGVNVSLSAGRGSQQGPEDSRARCLG